MSVANHAYARHENNVLICTNNVILAKCDNKDAIIVKLNDLKTCRFDMYINLVKINMIKYPVRTNRE